MRIIVFAAALTLGTAAFAQTGSGEPGVTRQGTVPDGKACAPQPYNARVGAYSTCPGEGYPPPPVVCSKKVTDRCIQTYEPGVRR